MTTICGKPVAWAVDGKEFQQIDTHKEKCINALEALEVALQEAVAAGRIDCLHLTIKTFAMLQAVMVDRECAKYQKDHPEYND